MLTKNYRRLVNQLAWSNTGGQAVLKATDDTTINISGSAIYTFLGSNFASFTKEMLLNTTGNGTTFIFGTSDQVESADDLNLVAECDDTLFTRGTSTKDIKNSSLDNIITLSQTVTYTGTEPLTIKEVALLGSLTNMTKGFITARIVLKAPIVLDPSAPDYNATFIFAIQIGD